MSVRALFDSHIDVPPRGWQWIDISVQKDDTLEIVVRENDGWDFDIHILHPEDVSESEFWDNYSVFTKEKESYFRGKHTFKEGGSYCFLVSNHRAHSVERNLYVKLTLKSSSKEDKKLVKAKVKTEKKRPKPDSSVPSAHTTDQEVQTRGFSWLGVAAIIVILILVTVSSLALWFVNPFLATIVFAVSNTLVFGVGRKEVRRILGLQE